ncbi:hypothetical protein B0H14DRAFT_2973119, partial [Mycena olivaceomarginata]
MVAHPRTFHIGTALLLASSAHLRLIRRLPPDMVCASCRRCHRGISLFFLLLFVPAHIDSVCHCPKIPKDLTPKGARPSKMHKSTAPPPFTVRFATVSADEAAQGLKCTSERKNTTLPSHSLASNIQVKELYLTPKQRREINALNTSDAILDAKFYVNGDQEQQSQYVAAALMALHGLDLASREANGNRWSVRWSTSKDGGKT